MGWSLQIKDVSFAGSSVTVAGITVTDFMDDANPVEFQDVEVSSVGVNCNGSMVRNAKPNVIMMSLTVIPGSQSDISLYNLWKRYRVQGNYNSQWEAPLTASVTIGSGRGSRSFSNGTMVSGPGGPSSNGEGKMTGRTYTFAFVTAN
jgi:hypothetical protein